jgi:hypothetical protein
MQTYLGGRSEVHLRRVISQVLYSDLCFAIGNTVLLAAGRLSDFWSDHPQANRLGSLLTIGHVNSDALGLC